MGIFDKKKCSFCGKNRNEVKRIISSVSNVNICNECVALCNSILKEKDYPESNEVLDAEQQLDLPSPKELNEFLDNYIIGQDKAKKVLSTAVYNHYKRINSLLKEDDDDVELEKSNILLIGPTGTGKTLFAKTLAKKLNVPFAIADATTLTQAGYVGDDVENILLSLYTAANEDISRAEIGIIYIDEIDKIARKGENMSITRDVSGEGVQQGLLKIVEGTTTTFPPQGGRKHPAQENIKINTANILFICGGAFVGLDKIVKTRINEKYIGFSKKEDHIDTDDIDFTLENVMNEDLVKFGLIPELIGRIPISCSLKNLTVDALKRILVEPKNSIIKQYKKLLKYDNIDLEFSEESISAIAQIAILKKTGARGLKSILENIMLDVMFEADPSNPISVNITPEDVYKKNPLVF